MAMELPKVDPDKDPHLLDEFKDDLLEMLNVTLLIQFLEDSNVLTEYDVKALRRLEQNRRAATAEFLSILKTKWHGALTLFIAALGTENNHTGHKRLYKMLKPRLKPSKERGKEHTEEVDNPRDAVSQHQVVPPVDQLTSTAERSSLVMTTSLSEFAGTDSGLVSGRIVRSGTLSSFSSSTISTRSRCSSPIEALMQQHLNILTKIDKKVSALAQSASSSFLSGLVNTEEHVITHQRSASCDSKPMENLVSHKKNSLDYHIFGKQMTRDDPPRMVSCS